MRKIFDIVPQGYRAPEKEEKPKRHKVSKADKKQLRARKRKKILTRIKDRKDRKKSKQKSSFFPFPGIIFIAGFLVIVVILLFVF